MVDTHIQFPDPCLEDWDAMHPAGRARHCDSCDQPVHDLIHYTPEEADALLNGSGGPACLRAHIAADGRVITKPSRFGKVLTAAVAAPAIFIALAATGAAACPDTGAISGSVKVGRSAPLSVTAVAEGLRRSAPVAADGSYRLDQLPPGTYRLEFKVRNAVWWAVDQVAVRANYVTVRRADMPTPQIPKPPRLPPMPVFVTGGIPIPSPPPPAPIATAPTAATATDEEVVVTAGRVASPVQKASPVATSAKGAN